MKVKRKIRTKTCQMCGEELEMNMFNYVEPERKDSYCKVCRVAYRRGYEAGRKYQNKQNT